MSSKLTLSVDPDVIAAAKRYAAEAGTSVSRLVQDYLAAIVTSPNAPQAPPVLAELRGSMRVVDDDAYHQHLVKKYG